MTETHSEKVSRQGRFLYYLQEGKVVFEAQQHGQGKTLAGESWAHGFKPEDHAREQEIRYQARIKEEAELGVSYVTEPGGWFDTVDAVSEGEEERRMLNLWTDQNAGENNVSREHSIGGVEPEDPQVPQS